jgi:ribonuclease PH
MERSDGRGPDRLRPVSITRSFLNTVPGSVLIEMGHTRVICTLALENRVPPFLIGTGKGWLTAEYSMLPGSSKQRVARESATGRPNSRAREIQRLIGRSLRALVDMESLGEHTLYVDCDVIQADGGTRTASITGAYVALAEGLERLCAQGVLKANPLREAAAAVSVGVVDGQVLLDLSYEEDVRAQTDMNVVMTGRGLLIEVQATAEGRPFTRSQADQMLDLAAQGIQELLEAQKQALSGLKAGGREIS